MVLAIGAAQSASAGSEIHRHWYTGDYAHALVTVTNDMGKPMNLEVECTFEEDGEPVAVASKIVGVLRPGNERTVEVVAHLAGAPFNETACELYGKPAP